MWDLGSKGWDQESEGGIWDQSPGITDHKPWDRDQQLSEGSGIRLHHFCGSGNKSCYAFGIKDQKFGYKNGISDEKSYHIMTLKLPK